MRERRRWRLGYWVTVEADGYDALDAHHGVEIATGWPGDWQPPADPVTVSGEHHRLGTTTATISRSVLLMVHEAPAPLLSVPEPEE